MKAAPAPTARRADKNQNQPKDFKPSKREKHPDDLCRLLDLLRDELLRAGWFLSTRGALTLARLHVRGIDVERHADGSYTVSRRGCSRRLPNFLALEDFAGGAQ